MGRQLPVECEHGCILDWGDFGGDNPPEGCAECDPQLLRTPVERDLDLGERAYNSVVVVPFLDERLDT